MSLASCGTSCWGREAKPTALMLDGRVLQSTPESGHRAGYNGGKRRQGSTAPIAVDTLGHLLSVGITPANEQERAQVVSRVPTLYGP